MLFICVWKVTQTLINVRLILAAVPLKNAAFPDETEKFCRNIPLFQRIKQPSITHPEAAGSRSLYMCIALGLNPGLCKDRPEINCLGYSWDFTDGIKYTSAQCVI
jgi:hypothetical protein